MRNRGLTLVELLVGLAVTGVLLGMCVPAFDHLISQQRATARINQMIAAVQVTRHAAITHRTYATLCPARNDACIGRNQWHLGTMIFADRNGNGQRDTGEAVLTRLPALREGERVYWRSFRRRRYLTFRANGLTDWQNGHFQYCPPDNDARYSRQVIVNAQGRVRPALDHDGDGIREDARGRPLECG